MPHGVRHSVRRFPSLRGKSSPHSSTRLLLVLTHSLTVPHISQSFPVLRIACPSGGKRHRVVLRTPVCLQ